VATIDDLNIVSAAFLDAATDALQLTPIGPPGRRFVSPGEPALDCCGQLTVWIQDITEVALQGGLGALAPAKRVLRGSMPSLLIFVQATRCSAAIAAWDAKANQLPDPFLLQQDVEMIDRDGWALRLGFADNIRNGELSRVCVGVEMLGGVKIIPQGGCIGWTFSFRYPLEGGVITT
jgi:hypothetical protein